MFKSIKRWLENPRCQKQGQYEMTTNPRSMKHSLEKDIRKAGKL